MSYMKRFLEDLVTEYQRKHPSASFDEAMNAVCNSEDPIKEIKPKGYLTTFGYRGLINGRYQLFSTEQEYKEVLLNA